MPVTDEWIEFVCESLGARSRKMFGGAMFYVEDRPIVLGVDDVAYVRQRPEVEEILADAEVAVPYEGAKPHWVLDVEDSELVQRLLPVLVAATPLPRRRKKS